MSPDHSQGGRGNTRSLVSGILKDKVFEEGEVATMPCAADGKSMVWNHVYKMLLFCLKGRSLYTYLCFTMPGTFLGECPKNLILCFLWRYTGALGG